MGEASSVIDFIVIHTYPLYWADFDDYAKGEMDFQVQLLCLHGLRTIIEMADLGSSSHI